MDLNAAHSTRARALEAEADQAAGRGDAGAARRLLEQAVAIDANRSEAWLKLAAMCRAASDLQAALAAVSGALRVEPLGFVPLMVKASLLDAVGRGDEAGEHYGYALAQIPEQVPAHLEPMVAHARQRHETHVAAAAQRLAAAADAAGEARSPVSRAMSCARLGLTIPSPPISIIQASASANSTIVRTSRGWRRSKRRRTRRGRISSG